MKIVVLRQLGGIGDCLMLSSVFLGLKEKYPGCHITWVLNEGFEGGALVALARHNPYVDEWMHIPPYEMTSAPTKRHWSLLYGSVPPIEEEFFWKTADLVIDLNTSCVEYEWPALKTKGGIQKPRYKLWLEAAGVTPSNPRPVYITTPDERAEALEYKRERWGDKRVVGIGLNASHNQRSVPIHILESIANGLANAGVHVVTIDGTRKLDKHDYLIGKPLYKIMPLIEVMDAVVSADSGILHMAGAMDVPIMGLFGPTDPEMRMELYRGSATNPRALVPCAPCWYNNPCTEGKVDVEKFACFKRINPAVVVEETLRWTRKTYKPLLMVN